VLKNLVYKIRARNIKSQTLEEVVAELVPSEEDLEQAKNQGDALAGELTRRHVEDSP
jgi:hypothetical protein